jgi:hemerythrin-like domain-containing protein
MIATDRLKQDHVLILSALDALGCMVAKLQKGEAVPAEDATAIVDFFRTWADKYHHEKEEQVFFPALCSAGLPQNGGPVGVMLMEHEQMRAMVGAIRDAAPVIDRKEARDEFVRAGAQYVAALQSHIHKENEILFMMAERMLPGHEDREIVDQFDRIELQALPGDTNAKYSKSVATLKAKYVQ